MPAVSRRRFPPDVNPVELLDLAVTTTVSELALDALDEPTPTDRCAVGPPGLALPAPSAQGVIDPFGRLAIAADCESFAGVRNDIGFTSAAAECSRCDELEECDGGNVTRLLIDANRLDPTPTATITSFADAP